MPNPSEGEGTSAAAQPGRARGLMTRRSALRGAAGAGAAGLALTTLPGAAVAAVRAEARHDRAGLAPDDARAGEAVVVHVRDVRSGEMDVYRGTSHTRVTDRDLAARLARASRQ
jgi:hypothetical protein